MNRRGHLSHKVPNVKLRPAPRRSARRAISPPSALDDEILHNAWRDAEESNDAGPSGMNDKPWRGIVVTFTGVEDKASLARLVLELGGLVESALTVEVTHVVAQGYGSAKYLYAIENRIPVLAPSWIHDAHSRWIKGDELDVPASIELHKLQPFVGLKISVTGIDNIEHRKKVVKYINGNGGVYSKDLDRSCTHLISAFSTTESQSKKSEKIKWALKELGDREAGRRRGRKYDDEDIRIVYEAWLWDCIAYGGRWTEDAYDARKPRNKALVTAEEVMNGTALQALAPKAAPQQQEEEDEPVVVRKRKRDGMDSLVGELLSTAKPPEDAGNEADVSGEEDAKRDQQEEAPEELPRRPGAFDRKPSLLHASRSTAFSAADSSSARLAPNTEMYGPNAEQPLLPPGPSIQFFSGLRFSHAIAEGYQGLENALVQYGGEVVSEEERLAGADVDYVIIRLASRTRPEMSEEEVDVKLVTECWVESCCFQRTLLSPDANLVFRPLRVPMPLTFIDPVLVHISGFPTEVTVYLRRLLKTLGAALSEKMNRNTTHLVCAAPEGLKYKKAKEWGLIVVKDSWLWTMARTGRVEREADHAHVEGDNVADGQEAADGVRTASTVTTNLSTTSEIGASMVGSTSLPPSRMLKLTPTHVDAGDPRDETPLTPSKPETQRLLNRATASPGRAASVPSRSERGTPEGGKRDKNDLKPAATMPAGGGQNDMTAALRRLAERDAGAPQRSKLTRRARPSRPKMDSGTPSMLSPSTTTSPVQPEPPAAAAAAAAFPVEDESMRVTYADPVSEKERKRLLDAVMRGGTSPAKRARA